MKKALLVCDESKVSETTRRMLGVADLHIVGDSVQPKAALRIVAALSPDIVVFVLSPDDAPENMDMVARKYEEEDAVRCVREAHPGVPIICVSPGASMELVERLLARGVKEIVNANHPQWVGTLYDELAKALSE